MNLNAYSISHINLFLIIHRRYCGIDFWTLYNFHPLELLRTCLMALDHLKMKCFHYHVKGNSFINSQMNAIQCYRRRLETLILRCYRRLAFGHRIYLSIHMDYCDLAFGHLLTSERHAFRSILKELYV